MELLLLLVILPAVQDQNHTREWLKNCIRGWCSVAAWIYDIRSYLFGDVDDEENGVVAEVGVVEAADADEEDNVAEEVEDEDEPPLFEAPYYAEADPDPVAPAVADGDVPAVAPFADAAIGAGIGGDGGLGLGAAHQAMLQRDGPTGTQPYIRPSWFPLRVRKCA
jgi:E3 ubiquitin-protein ligase MARCH6